MQAFLRLLRRQPVAHNTAALLNSGSNSPFIEMTTAANYQHEGTNDMLNTPSENNQTYHHVLFAEEEQSEGDFHELVNKLRAVRRQGMKKVVHLALGFFFLFAAYNTIQNYVTTLLPGCLGFTSLCVLYVSVCPSLLLAPDLGKIGDRWTLVLGALCYSVWIASLTRPDIPSLVIAASVIIGFGAAILWVAQGTYLTKQGDETIEVVSRNFLGDISNKWYRR